MTTEEKGEDAPGPSMLPAPDTASLSDSLARVVAEAYAGVLQEEMPERMKALIDSIKRLEAGQKKAE